MQATDMRSLSREARHERRVQVIRLRKAGNTYEEIAVLTGLSRTGVFNICKRHEALGAKGLTSGRLRVAVVSTAKYFIPRLLGSFCKLHPQIDISLEVLNRDHVITRLRSNLDDLYVMSRPPEDLLLEDQILMPNPLVVIASAGHKLAAKKRVNMAQLQGERLLLREKGSGTRMATDAHLRQLGFVPTAVLELGSNEAIKESVEGQLGVSILSRHALGAHHDGLAVLDVQGFPIQSHWHLVWPKGKQLSPIAEVFRGHLVGEAKGWLGVR